MQKLPLLFFLALGILVSSCATDDTAKPTYPNAPNNPDRLKLLALLNDARSTSTNCGGTVQPPAPALVWNDTLALVARLHSEDMDAANRLSHNGTDGSFLDDRLERAGFTATVWAENLAQGAASETEVIQLWLDSEGHCENSMNAQVQEVGLGTSGPYWTMVLARRN